MNTQPYYQRTTFFTSFSSKVCREMASGKTYKGCAVFLALVSLVSLGYGAAEGKVFSPKEIELRRILKQINKPAVKSIKGKNGEVIDCVDIYKQPAFDHPLLANHTIQMKPSFYPRKDKEDFSIDVLQRIHPVKQCPEGTIPIQRIQKKDLLRAASLSSYGKKNPQHVPRLESTGALRTGIGHEHSVAFLRNGKFYGAKASINLWNPRVNPFEFSLAQIWILSDVDTENAVEAGWMVYPSLYGDNETRLFTFWTADNYKSKGCYNLLCPGFVQTNHKYLINSKFAPISTYGGEQFYISIEIRKDKMTGNWWLHVQGNEMGYWPNSLLPALQESAKFIEWGGEITNLNEATGGSTTTQMGSGHFPDEGYGKAGYFANIKIVDNNDNLRDADDLQTIIERPNCYNLKLDGNKGGQWGTMFYYGGPGKSENCP